MGWEKFQFGQLYSNKTAIDVPKNPIVGGDIPAHIEGNELSIAEASGTETICWVKPDGMNLLIADRVLLTNISWNELSKHGFVLGKELVLDNRRYRCRLLQVGTAWDETNEWDTVLDATSESNDLWHWEHSYFWGQDVAAVNKSLRAVRGYSSARYWTYTSHVSKNIFDGFRPVLEILSIVPLCFGRPVVLDEQSFVVSQLQGTISEMFYPQLSPVGKNSFANIPNGAIVRMYTLLCDGKPVRQNGKVSPTRAKGELSFTDQFYGDEFLIPWVISNGIAVASRPVLQGIGPDALKEQGYL